MRRIIQLALVLIICAQLANATTPTDSLRDQVIELRGAFKRQGEALKLQNDSLQRELLFYKVKEDFYTESLGGQTAIFSLITGALLTLAALISWKFITDQIMMVKLQLSNQIVFVENKLEEKQENDIIIRYQTLKNAFDLGYVTLKPIVESKLDFGFGIYIGVMLMNQANQAIKVHPKRLINRSKFNEDPQQLVNTFNSLCLLVKGSLESVIGKLDELDIEVVEFMTKIYAPMCEYNLIQLTEDIFEGGRRNDIIDIKYLYLDMIKEIDRRVSKMNKSETSVIDIKIEEEK